MGRLVQTVALGAAVVALAVGVWRDYGAFTALKRAVMAYLATYFVAGGLSLATRAALSAVRDPDPEPEPKPARKKWRRKPARPPQEAVEETPSADATPDEQTDPTPAEPVAQP